MAARNNYLGQLMVYALLALLTGCAEKQFDPNDPAKSYGIAKEPYDDKNWEMAVTRLGEFRARFPYSQFAVEAELLIANAQFNLERFAEAAASYEQFVKLHPRHPEVDFAMYRIGESYWSDSPEEIDREQENTERAVEEWKTLVAAKPDSSYSSKAKELIAKGQRRIADSEAFVAAFYCKQKIWHACAYRWVNLMAKFPQYDDLKATGKEEASRALREVAKAKDEDPKTDKNLYVKAMSADEIRAKAAALTQQSKDVTE